MPDNSKAIWVGGFKPETAMAHAMNARDADILAFWHFWPQAERDALMERASDRNMAIFSFEPYSAKIRNGIIYAWYATNHFQLRVSENVRNASDASMWRKLARASVQRQVIVPPYLWEYSCLNTYGFAIYPNDGCKTQFGRIDDEQSGNSGIASRSHETSCQSVGSPFGDGTPNHNGAVA